MGNTSLGTADILVRAKTGEYHKKIGAAEDRIKKFGKSAVTSIGSVTSSFASLAGIGGIGAMTAGIITTGAKFESQMATVKGVMRATADEYDLLKAAALEAGEKTEWSATQSAEALNYMGMAGYSAQQAISALPDVLNLATAAGMDLGRASDIVTDSLTAMGLGVQDLSHFNDVLVGTITRSNTNIEMMGETLKYAAPIAKQYGFDIESLSAMIGALANAGIKGSDAGTDLRQAMVRNSKAAKELGTAENDLIGTLKAAKAAGWGVNEVTEKYGMIASKSVLVLMDQVGAYDNLYAQLQNVQGETQKLAETKLDTLSGDFKILKSTVEGLALAVSDDTNRSVRGAVQEMTATIRENKDTIISLFTGIVTAGSKAVDIVSQITRSVELLGVAAASSDKSLWDWFTLTPEGAKQWKQEVADGTAFLKDQLHDIREEIDQLEYVKNFGVGRLTAEQNAALYHFKEQEKQIIASIQKIQSAKESQTPSPTPGENRRNDSPPSTLTAASAGGIQKKQADAIASAYRSAYASMDTMTQAVYDKMMGYAHQKYQENKKLLGDEETAYSLYAQEIADINDKMYGTKMDSALSAFFDDIDAEAERYNNLMIEGAQVTENMRTPAEQLAIKIAHLNDLFQVGAISLETYNRAALNAEETLASGRVDDALNAFFNDLDAEANSLAEGGYWDLFLSSMENNMMNMDQLVGSTIQGWTSQFGNFFASAIMDSDSLGDAFGTMAQGMATSMISAIGEMIAQWLVYQAVKLFVDKSAQAGAAVGMTANAEAAALQAGINAYASAAAIPMTGWLIAPGAMAAALAATQPMAASIAALATTAAVGMAHEGIDEIPKSGTWLLEKGERVTTEGTSRRLDQTLANVQATLSGSVAAASPMNVNVYEAAGTTAQVHQNDDGSIDVIIAQVEQAMTRRMNRGTGLAAYFDRRYGRKW